MSEHLSSSAEWLLERAHERLESAAEQVGRLSYYAGQLLALDEVRGEVPAEYLRDALHRVAEQARRADLSHVKADDVDQYVTWHQGDVQTWRYLRSTRTSRSGR